MSEPSDLHLHRDACGRILPKLAGVVDGGISLDARERAHVDNCLQCQAELVRYRKLLRALHDLRTQVVRPAPGLLAGILDHVGERAEQRAVRSLVTGKRIAYTSGIAVAAVAGVTGMVLLTGRSRKHGQKAA